MTLAEPAWLALLLLIPFLWLFERARPRLLWPTLSSFPGKSSIAAVLLRWIPIALRAFALACLAIAMSRPQAVGGTTRVIGKGVTIVVALDHSRSMNAVDPSPAGAPLTRLEAAKQTFAKFVERRPDDPIGLVVFANYPDRASPPTLGHSFLLAAARAIRTAPVDEEGTNIGDAIAWALEDLRTAPTQRKVLILLTDGQNVPAVSRPLPPEAAALLARELGVTLHTIAVGQSDGIVRGVEPTTGLSVPAHVDAPDFALLERLARIGGGRAFVAADADSLERVFATINTLEKSTVQGEIRIRYRETFAPWIVAAFTLLSLDRFLVAGRLRRLP